MCIGYTLRGQTKLKEKGLILSSLLSGFFTATIYTKLLKLPILTNAKIHISLNNTINN